MEIKRFYHEILGFRGESLIEEISAVSSIRNFCKGEMLLWQGDPQTSILFLLKGILRGYYIKPDGKEVTDCFGSQIGDPAVACFDITKPTEISIVAVTDAECVELPVSELQRLGGKYTEVMRIHNELLWRGMKRHHDIKHAINSMEAPERYQWFLREYPGLIDVVRHKDIASFIGTTPVNLSRVRAKLQAQEKAAQEKAAYSENK